MKPKMRKLWWILGAVAVVLAAAAVGIGLVCANRYELTLRVGGEPEVTLEYGSDYTPPEADAFYCGTIFQKQPVAVAVEQSGQVDPNVVGDYVLTYRACYGGIEQTQTRTVHIVDTQMPKILLVASSSHYTLPGAVYEEEGYSAYDDYDGVLTEQVERIQTDTEVIYRVTDSSGNLVERRRTIVYDDPVAPVLTLKGDAQISLTVGEDYQEPGYIASDNCDGELTEKVHVTGKVDTGTPGTYELTYQVEDAYGNAATATRTVTVRAKPAAKPAPKPVQPEQNRGKTIYLTFDDGPGPYTHQLLEVLRKYNVKATFFVVNTGYVELLREIAGDGHSVGVHSVSHDYRTIYASEEAYFSDLYQMQAIIEHYTGVKTMLVRFPGGSSNQVSRFNPGIMTRLTKAVEEKGFRYFDWNVSSGDAGNASTADEVFWNVVNGIGNKTNSVVLQHDIKEFSVEAVERIIQWGLENGYRFAALTTDSPSCHHRIFN